jgi:ribosomal protein S18 acetylase RimI-like enzyme
MNHLIPVETKEEIHETAHLARHIWTEHYVPIIGKGQVEYMLKKFQSFSALQAQITQGYRYYLARREKESVGYLALLPHKETASLMISKIYVDLSARHTGMGTHMLCYAEEYGRAHALSRLWLTVNKNNSESIAWYTRRGFCKIQSLIQDIGGGFVMDDFVFEKQIV